jgi:hypothetical protein
MSENKELPSVDDFVVNLEFAVKDVNTLLNILNMPSQAPVVTLAAFINGIQMQAGPQVKKAEESLAAVAKAQDESQATA